ncbi:MAG: hypothetical protein KME42_10310 [Tildeniella nuda ZEHNDER 1965/U140]|nr:hypothetical protein [Tildeniella nuda ZEHNDER 1965/U140]
MFIISNSGTIAPASLPSPIALSKPPYRLICLSTSSRASIAPFKLGSRAM